MTTTAFPQPVQTTTEVDRLATLTRRAEALRAEAHALTEERNDLARALLEQGWTLADLAQKAGCSPQAMGFATGCYRRWKPRSR